MNTQTTSRKSNLIKIYHSVCSLRGMDADDRKVFLHQYGVESSSDLNEKQLSEIIEKLQQEPNIWRRRVIAAVGAWLRVTGRTENIDIIKAIACRAAGTETFNKITVSRLRDIYHEFSRKAKTAHQIFHITDEQISSLQLQN